MDTRLGRARRLSASLAHQDGGRKTHLGRDPCLLQFLVRSATEPTSLPIDLIPIWSCWKMGRQNRPTGRSIMISRRLVIGLLGAVAFALYAAPVALARSPEARNAKLDEILQG